MRIDLERTPFVTMGRTVKVCGTPTAIPLEITRDESEFKSGCVLQTTQNGLIVMGTDESLRVVDARKFCAGIVDVRHIVELPSGATFIRRKSTDGTGIAWKNALDDDGEWSCVIYIVDFQTGDVAVRSLPRLDEMAADIFVDNKGEQVAVVGTTSGKLHGWSLSDIDYNQFSSTGRQSEWRIADALTVDTALVRSCSCWRFVSSAVIGNCFVYLRARSNTSGAVVIEKWILDVESNWLPVAYSSRTLTDSDADSTEGLALFVSEEWTFVILTVGKVLYHFDIDQDLTDRPIKRLLLDHNVVDGAWIDQDAAFAILFVNGQISIASVGDAGCFELLGIETSSTMSKRLSLSALLGKAVPTALQLVWVEQEKQLIVDFGETRSGFNVGVVDEESSAIVDDGLGESLELCPSIRRMRTCTNCDGYIRELLESKSPPSLNDLLDVSKFALSRSQETFEDSYFMVLSKVHQQLADDIAKARNCHDPIDWVGKSLKLMEVLVSFTISMGGTTLWQISSKILSVLPGCTTPFDRKLYYRKEIEAISSEMRKMTNGSVEDEDWWVGSMEVTAFLRVYFITIRSLLQDIQASTNMKPGEASQILSQCQWVIEHQDMLDALPRDKKCDNLLADRLKGLLISYTITCCCLGVNGVLFDLEHLFSLVPHINLKREEFVCCFLKPWKLLKDTPVTKDELRRAVALATQSNAMQLLMNLCMESKSLEAHSCIQVLCTAAATMATPASDNILQVENLHWQACETYIGEAMAILHRIGPRRTFKYPNREAECISGCLSEAIDSELSDFLRSLSFEPTRTATKYHATTRNNSLWEFSRLDNLLRARVICLISRVLWHLETSTEDIGDIFQHAFAMVATQSTLSAENQLYDCLQNVRLIISPVEKELRLPRFRHIKDPHVRFCCRSQTIARSLVLVTWALWLREKAAFCRRYIRIGSMEKATTKTETIGDLAATCALSINALGMIYGENEGLQTIQLSLLEDAAALNPIKTAAVIAWGFPTQKISTRYLKRYMMIRQAVQRASVDMSLEDKELHLQQLRTRVRSAFHHFFGNFENEVLTEVKTSDIDVLTGSCCDQASLQIMSMLAKCPYEQVTPVDPFGEKSRPGTSTPVLEFPRNSRDVDSVTPSTTGNEAPCLSIPQVPDSLISRDEVIALLQAQTRQLEEKMQEVSISGRSTHQPSSHKDIQSVPVAELLVSKHGKTSDNGIETAVRLADSQRMARVSLQVRDLRRHRYSSASSEAEVQSNPLDKSIQRHDSVRNALKLFRLRQENCVQPPSEKVPVVIENGGASVQNGDNSVVDVKTILSAQSPTVSTRRDKLQRDSAKRKSSRNQRCSERQGCSWTEPVYPLRLEYGADNASLKLLGRYSQQYNPSVKKRQFVHQHRERLPKTYTQTSNADVEVIQLKTVSAQTNNLNDSIEPALSVSVPVKEVEQLVGSEQDNLEPEKGSPVVQECDDTEPISKGTSLKGVGIQCRMTEKGSSKGARKRGPPSLKIADKFPIWVDLNSADNIGTRSHFKERKKFLQVAGFGVSDTMQHYTNNDTTEGSALTTISPKTMVYRVTDDSEVNQSDSQHSPCSSSSQAHDDVAKHNVMNAMHRTRYKEQYPVQNRSRRREDEEGGSGINSLIDLRDDMQRMTQRLRELETCANSIDEEFKVSQKRLSRIGDISTSQARMLQDIDEVLEMTEEDYQGERKTPRGLLSKNASSNLNAAKKLLGTIEQLAISADD